MSARRVAVVSVSGGKDSTATALLAIERVGLDGCRFVYADTGNEHEITDRYVKEYLPGALGAAIDVVRADFAKDIERKRLYVMSQWASKGVPQNAIDRALEILRPTGNPFLDLCIMKGRFPSRRAQFCTQYLKRLPLDNYLLDLMGDGCEVSSWRGVRRDESAARTNTPSRELTAEGYWIEHPIASWSAQDVIDFVRAHGIDLNPLYTQGMGRVGCMPCINCRKDELLEISKRWPDHIDRIREWERLTSLASKRGVTTFFTDSLEVGETDAEIFDRLKIDSRVEWAKTSRGGAQFDFLRMADPIACKSAYGLCE